MSLHVVHVIRQYYPSVGGMEDVVRNIASSQRATGRQTASVVTLNRLFRNSGELLEPADIVDGVPVTRLPYRGSSRYPLCPSVLREINRADVVHVHGVDFFFDYLAATRLVHRRPLLVSTHGGFFHTEFASRLKEIWFRTITRASSRAYDRVVATSENDGNRFRDIVPDGRLEVIENGVNTDKYAGRGREEINRTLIYFGRWSSNKGLLEALDLIRVLREQDGRWHLIIAGREYDFSLESLDREVRRRNLGDGAVTLEASPSDQRLSELMGQASYFLCLSRHEGFGLAAIEAMSAGLTPVLSDIPPFRKLKEASGIGLCADASAPEALADHVQHLHEQGQVAYQERRDEAMVFARQYSWPRIADRYIQLYDTLGGPR
ncbi:glycosyltransferase family 4 protein [Marinobacter sp. LN3S78]|uniref:glycosyltransferase family 4 protein n=1 Tax=Marinobacter sp. LN3S78 TaxID=3382300 RepID=UPI00387B767C